MISISFHSGGFVDKPLAWVIEHLGSIGYDGIEIVCGPKAHIKPDEVSQGELEDIKGLLEQHSLKVAAINPYTVPQLPNMWKQDQAEAERFYRKLIDLAAFFGAPTVNFLTGWFPEGDAEGWKVLVEALKPMLSYAQERGVCMTIHNHEGTVIDTPDKAKLLMEHVGMPNLKVLFDVTNFWILGTDICWAVHRLSPHILHCHIKGVKGKYPFNQFLIPGEDGDELPFDEFASALSEVGYDRFISVETFSGMREEKAKIAFEMMSQRLAKLGLR